MSTKHVYRVEFQVKWKHRGKRSWWDDQNVLNIVANGDARKAVRQAEQKAMRMKLDESDLKDGVLWRAIGFRLVSVTQGVEVVS